MPNKMLLYLVEAEAAILMMSPVQNRLRAWLLDVCEGGSLLMTTECFRVLREMDSNIAQELKDTGLVLIEIDGSVLAVAKEIGAKLNGSVGKIMKSPSNQNKIYRLAVARIKETAILTVDVQSPISTKCLCDGLKIETLDPRTIQ